MKKLLKLLPVQIIRAVLKTQLPKNWSWKSYLLNTQTPRSDYFPWQSPQWLLPLTVHLSSNAWRNRCEEIAKHTYLIRPGRGMLMSSAVGKDNVFVTRLLVYDIRIFIIHCHERSPMILDVWTICKKGVFIFYRFVLVNRISVINS